MPGFDWLSATLLQLSNRGPPKWFLLFSLWCLDRGMRLSHKIMDDLSALLEETIGKGTQFVSGLDINSKVLP